MILFQNLIIRLTPCPNKGINRKSFMIKKIVFKSGFKIAMLDLADNDAISSLTDFVKANPEFSEGDFKSVNCLECQQEEYVGKPLQVICSVSGIPNPMPSYVLNEENVPVRVSLNRLKLKDQQNNELETFEVDSKNLVEILQSTTPNSLVKVKGTIISVNQPFWCAYVFYVTEVIPVLTQLDLLRIDKPSLDNTAKLVTELSNTPGGLRNYLKRQLIEMYNIRGLDLAKELGKAIDFTIIQAFSSGMSIGNIYSNKLHSLIIGSPASGKKLITKSALALSPNGKHISSTSSKVTAAGLVGFSRKGNGGFISQPGLLPLANDAVVCFEDFHEIAKRKNEISGILSQVMEDGKVDDSTAAKMTHIACTSINIDMNRMSQVNHTGEFNSYSDLNIPLNIISRFDFIMEIPADTERQMKVSLDMVGRFPKLVSETPSLQQSETEKSLKQIVAYVNTNFKSVTVSKEVNDCVKAKLEEIFRSNQDLAAVQKHMGSMLTRLQISVEKFSKAIATSKLQKEVSIDDVDEAFSFILYKLEFLANLGFMKHSTGKVSEKQTRQAQILELFKDKDFTAADVGKHISNDSDLQIDGRTIHRDLAELVQTGKAKKVKHGLYRIVA